MQVVRGELVMPFQLACCRIYTYNAVCVKMVAFMLIAVISGIRITDAPEQRIGFAVVRVGNSCRPAGCNSVAHPSLRSWLTRLGNRPKAPCGLTCGCLVRIKTTTT